jgi:hypothetical protein
MIQWAYAKTCDHQWALFFLFVFALVAKGSQKLFFFQSDRVIFCAGAGKWFYF